MKKEKDNLLLTKAIWRNVPPFTFIILLNIFAIMVDFIVSSIFLTPTHVTCVGITLPYFTLMLAILEAFSDGAGLYISQEKGRGDKEKVNHIFAGSIVFLTILGVTLVLLTTVFCVPIIKIFGGSTDEIVSLTKPYLILVSLQGIFMAIYSLFARLVILLVSAKHIVIATLANMVINIVVSVVLVTNTGLGLAALGIGTVSAVLISVVYLYVVLICKTNLKFKLTIINKKEIAKTARLGFPSSGDKIASGLMGGVINNIIGANLGVLAIGIYSSIKLVFALSQSSIDGIIGTTSPLYGVIYGAQDKNGIKKTFKSSMSIGMISTFVWSLVILLTMPVWTAVFGKSLPADGKNLILIGSGIMMLFYPAYLYLKMLATLYEATERTVLATLCLILPDSLVFPLLLLFFIPMMNYTGIWLAYGLSFVIICIVFAAYIFVKYKKFNLECMLQIDDVIHEDVPALDISIKSENEKVSEISERIYSFLKKENGEERIAYMGSLCLEELIMDIVLHDTKKSGKERKQILDIKMFADKGKVKISVRNEGKKYNPLDFVYNKDDFKKVGVVMVQKLAEQIEFDYVYNMNVVKITI